jgi:hypothetical protein
LAHPEASVEVLRVVDHDIPGGEKLSLGLRLTLEGEDRDQRFQESFPDADEDELISLADICDNIVQNAVDLGIAITDRRIRQKDFEPRMTQLFPFLSDDDINLLFDAAMKAAK